MKSLYLLVVTVQVNTSKLRADVQSTKRWHSESRIRKRIRGAIGTENKEIRITVAGGEFGSKRRHLKNAKSATHWV